MKNSVLVLISTYNGEKYVSQLLDSVLEQKGIDVSILVRDDGSKDGTTKILEEYKKENKIEYYIGEQNLGYAKSFWHLLTNCSKEYDYYAFCDQDDIWLEDKLQKAIELIEYSKEDEKQPVLYTSNVIPVNNNMEILEDRCFECKRVLNVWESFQKSILPGCTFVFNSYAREILRQYQGYMESHDWATYAIITTFGKVVYDNKSYIHYRIHENNTIGITKGKFAKLRIKIKRFFKERKNVRSRFAKDFYDCYEDSIDNRYKESIRNLGYYRDNFASKIKLILDKKFKGIIFKIYVILNRV